MALLDTLRERTARKGGSAQVDCGELGVLTVEALSPMECVRLAQDPRALFYAACRELQRSGEELRKAGRVFRPDEIMSYVTDSEAAAAANAVMELSGMHRSEQSGLSDEQINASEVGAFRHEIVQDLYPADETPPAENENASEVGAFRHFFVQPFDGDGNESGQVSREISPEDEKKTGIFQTDKKSQILGDLSASPAQIVVSDVMFAPADQMANPVERFPLHETTSDLHEMKSESTEGHLHETKSYFGEALHETESDFSKSEAWELHEIKSESASGVHEIKSEVQKFLHEIKSELAEEAAYALAEGLRRAAMVR